MRKCTKRWLLPVFAAAMTLSAGFSSLAEETVKVTVPNVKGDIWKSPMRKTDARFIFRWERQSPFLKGQNWQLMLLVYKV